MMMKYLIAALCFCIIALPGCGDTDIQMATNAGMDAVKALTLSDRDVLEIAITGNAVFRQTAHHGSA